MSLVFIIFCGIIGCFSILYFLYLIIYGGGAGFTYFWLLLSIIAFGMCFIITKYDFIKEHVPKIIRNIVIIMMVFIIVSFFVIEFFIIKDGIKKENYAKTEYVIVLGARVRGTDLSLALYHRINAALEYMNNNKESYVIVSGGQGSGEDITEAEAMRRYLVQHGIEENRIILEERSTSTEENIRYSLEIINKRNSESDVTIITSDYHVFRAKKLLQKHDKQVQGIPSKTFPPLIINYYVREYFAVLKDVIFK